MNRTRRSLPAILPLLLIGAGLAPVPASAQPGVPPVAKLTASPNPVKRGEVVTLDASGSAGDGQSTITKYEWDLDGDGVFERDTGSLPRTSAAYGRAGDVTLRVRITDSEGDIAEAETHLRVNAPPVAGFIYEPSAPTVDQRIILSSTSTDPDGTIDAGDFSWDLDGDGQFDDAHGQTITVSFAKAGKHRVRLRVVDADGEAATAARKIPVKSKGSARRLMSPFPIVRLAGELAGNGRTRIKLLAVRGPASATVTVRCDGHDCPFDQRRRTIRRHRVTFPELEQSFEPQTTFEIFVTQPGRIGKFTRFALRDGKPPKRSDRCVTPGGRPIECPGG